MQKNQRIAIARIFSDLIKADRIVDAGEMDYWKTVCERYQIDREIHSAASEMPLAQALDVICDGDDSKLKSRLLEECRAMTVSDGFCAHSEAMLMMALNVMLDNDCELWGSVISVPRAGFNIDTATALYIENCYDAEVNDVVTATYRSLFKEFQLSGFHFIYIPKIIEHYNQTDPGLFRSILSFLAPSISPAGIYTIYGSLMKMNTAVFCQDILCNKLGINELRDVRPSLLIKISNSFVGPTEYANYLRINVDRDVVSQVRRFVDDFTEMLSSDVFIVSTSEERDNQFHFHGFYKQLLDIFIERRNIRSTVVIDPQKEEILFPDIDSKASGLHRRERALYALLLCAGREGISFTAPRNASALARYKQQMQQLQRRYEAIYEMFGGAAEQAPDLSVPEIRRPILSCLRKSINGLTALYNLSDYNVSKSGDGVFAVHLEPELVKVAELHSATPVALRESKLYRTVTAI